MTLNMKQKKSFVDPNILATHIEDEANVGISSVLSFPSKWCTFGRKRDRISRWQAEPEVLKQKPG